MLPFVIGDFEIDFEIMAKRKKVASLEDSSSDVSGQEPTSPGAIGLPADDLLPSQRQRTIASMVISVHFLALLITLSANLAPSFLQGKLTRWLSPYLVTTNQAYNAFPLELTHAEPFDFPMYLEFRSANSASDRWEKLDLPGITNPTSRLAAWRFSRWTNLSRVVRLIFTEQPDIEILSDITAHLVGVAEQQSGDTFREVRWMAPKVLSYDEDARLANGEAGLTEDEFSPSIVYSATVVHGPAGQLSLVPQQIPLRTAKPVGQPIGQGKQGP